MTSRCRPPGGHCCEARATLMGWSAEPPIRRWLALPGPAAVPHIAALASPVSSITTPANSATSGQTLVCVLCLQRHLTTAQRTPYRARPAGQREEIAFRLRPSHTVPVGRLAGGTLRVFGSLRHAPPPTCHDVIGPAPFELRSSITPNNSAVGSDGTPRNVLFAGSAWHAVMTTPSPCVFAGEKLVFRLVSADWYEQASEVISAAFNRRESWTAPTGSDHDGGEGRVDACEAGIRRWRDLGQLGEASGDYLARSVKMIFFYLHDALAAHAVRACVAERKHCMQSFVAHGLAEETDLVVLNWRRQ